MARSCRVCQKQTKHFYGEYKLCRVCATRLERDIARWRKGLDEDLDKIVAFDAHVAEREQRSDSD